MPIVTETSAAGIYFDASGDSMTGYQSDYDIVTCNTKNARGMAANTGTGAVTQNAAVRVRSANMSVIWIIRIK